MASLTVRNKLDQMVSTDKKILGVVTPIDVDPLATFVVGDNEIGPTMQQQITNGIFQIVSTVASADAGSGFVSALDLMTVAARKILDIDTGEYFTPDSLFARVTTASGITADAEVTLGIVGPNYDDLVPSKTLSAMRAVDDTWNETIEGKSEVIYGPAEIWIAVKTAAVGVQLEADVFVYGKGNLT